MRHLFGLFGQGAERTARIVASPSTELAVQFGCLSARIRINPGPEGPLRAHPAVRPAPATGREGRSGGELERRLRRGPGRGQRRGPRRQTDPGQIASDRGRIGQGGEDPQAPATGRAFAEVGGKHPRQPHGGRHRRLTSQILVLPMRRRCTGSRNTAFPQGHSDRDPIGRPRAGIRQDEVGLHVLLAKKVLV